MNSTNVQEKKYIRFSIAVLIIFFIFLLLRRAWLCDDAFITFRTVDNLLNGYRFTWNVTERVQVYTHPLWMLLIASVNYFLRDIYLTAISVSFILSILTVSLLAFRISKLETAALLSITILCFSKSFMDYSTSGLENPLSHLLLVLFFIVYFAYRNNTRKLLLLSIITSLAVTNRMDTLLFLLPSLIIATIQCKGQKRFLYLVIGQLPFVLWELFSVFYYGFPFPNTAYAKLNTGIPANEMIRQGFLYLLNAVQHDPITPMIIVIGMITPFLVRNKKLIPIAIGICLHLLYIIKIGGDFMSGRFLTIPLLGAVIIISQFDLSKLSTLSLAIVFATPIIIGISTPNSTLEINSFGPIDSGPLHVGENGILDERLLYYGGTGLLNAERSDGLPNFYWGIHGEEARYEQLTIADAYGVGLFGYYAGPDVFVLDKLAIADPLLARIPARRRIDWRPGHFEREMPDGYLQTLLSGNNSLEDPDLHFFYDKLSLITRGGLFDPKRLVEIWKMNTGQYNNLIDKDRYRYPNMIKVNVSDLKDSIPNKTGCGDQAVIIIDDSGIEISISEISHVKIIEVSLDHNDIYQIDYLLGDETIDSQIIGTAHLQNPGGMSRRRFYTPRSTQRSGFDSLRILPITGESEYCIGAISLE